MTAQHKVSKTRAYEIVRPLFERLYNACGLSNDQAEAADGRLFSRIMADGPTPAVLSWQVEYLRQTARLIEPAFLSAITFVGSNDDTPDPLERATSVFDAETDREAVTWEPPQERYTGPTRRSTHASGISPMSPSVPESGKCDGCLKVGHVNVVKRRNREEAWLCSRCHSRYRNPVQGSVDTGDA